MGLRIGSTTLIRTAALGVATAGLWVGLTQQPQQQPPADLNVIRVADDLHVLEGSGGNVAVYTTDEGVILVDDKFERNIPQILEKVASITDKPVRYVLNTHQHGDHTGGNAGLMTRGIEAVIHDNARANMVEGSQPGLPRISFAQTIAIHLGGKEVRAYHFGRGHTNGDSFIYFPARRTLHSGDMFVSGPPFIDYSNGGSAAEWPATLSKAAATLDFDTVIPGHGPVMKKADLLSWKTSFETVQARIRDLHRKGVSEEDGAKQLKFDDLAGWNTGNTGLFSRGFAGFWREMQP